MRAIYLARKVARFNLRATLTFEHNTRVQLKQVFEAISELMTPPEPAHVKKRPIGFVEPDEKSGTPGAAKYSRVGWARFLCPRGLVDTTDKIPH